MRRTLKSIKTGHTIEEQSASKVHEAIQAGADLNELNEDLTPLMKVVLMENQELVKILIASGANVNAQSEEGGWTALLLAAAFCDNAEIVSFLINAGADLNAQNSDGLNPLMCAAGSNLNELVAVKLIQAGCDVNARNDQGVTPLMWAASANPNPEIIKLLLKNGAKVNARQDVGLTAFIIAAAGNANPEVLEELIKGGADIYAVSYEGESVLPLMEDNIWLCNTSLYEKLKREITFHQQEDRNNGDNAPGKKSADAMQHQGKN